MAGRMSIGDFSAQRMRRKQAFNRRHQDLIRDELIKWLTDAVAGVSTLSSKQCCHNIVPKRR